MNLIVFELDTVRENQCFRPAVDLVQFNVLFNFIFWKQKHLL